jgi:N,N'-diacetyllegionaminate synthase
MRFILLPRDREETMTQLIAEFCQNHNGNMDLLACMVEAAAKAGATHGKMQTILADTIAYRPQFEEGLVIEEVIKSIKRSYVVEYQRLKGLEVSQKDTLKFVDLCRQNGLVPMTTCFVRAHANNIAQAGFKSIKVASYDCASFPMLRELGTLFDEIVVSTGATFDDEVIHAAAILKDKSFAFLHCVTLYPTPLEQMHLLRMQWLRTMAPRVGFSDHSLVARDGLIASKAALALGADIIERHFTVLGPTESRDGPVSITPEHMAELAGFAALDPQERLQRMDAEHPAWRVMWGQQQRQLSDQELLNRDYYRGRFASPRPESRNGTRMIFNWEETPLA